MSFKPQAVLGNDAEWIFDQKVCGWRDVGYKLGKGIGGAAESFDNRSLK